MFANAFYIPNDIHRHDSWPKVSRDAFAGFSPRLQELLRRSVEDERR